MVKIQPQQSGNSSASCSSPLSLSLSLSNWRSLFFENSNRRFSSTLNTRKKGGRILTQDQKAILQQDWERARYLPRFLQRFFLLCPHPVVIAALSGTCSSNEPLLLLFDRWIPWLLFCCVCSPFLLTFIELPSFPNWILDGNRFASLCTGAYRLWKSRGLCSGYQVTAVISFVFLFLGWFEAFPVFFSHFLVLYRANSSNCFGKDYDF